MLCCVSCVSSVAHHESECVCVQEDKVYVQHRVSENAELLWDLIANKSACFYIAG